MSVCVNVIKPQGLEPLQFPTNFRSPSSRRLYEAASARKTLVVVPEADHNADELLAGDDVIRAIVRFLLPLR